MSLSLFESMETERGREGEEKTLPKHGRGKRRTDGRTTKLKKKKETRKLMAREGRGGGGGRRRAKFCCQISREGRRERDTSSLHKSFT